MQKIQQELRQCNGEEREYLELYRDKIVEELKKLQRRKHKQHQQKGVHNRFRNKFTTHIQNNPHLKKIMREIKKELPQEAKRLQQLRRQNPRQFMQKLRRLTKELKELKELKQKDPQAYEIVKKEKDLEHKVDKLVKEIEVAESEERQAKVAQLKSLLIEIFSLRSSMREREIIELQSQVEKLKQHLQKRQANREIIIDRRLKNLIGEGGEWEW